MKFKAVLTLTAIVSSVLGATVVYLMLSVPNDLRADAMLKTAQRQIESGSEREARVSLSKIVQQYPRTDAAAAATVALVALGQKDRDALRRDMLAIQKRNEQITSMVLSLQKSVTEVKNAPPKVIKVEVPAPKPKPKPAPPKKKRAPVRKRR